MAYTDFNLEEVLGSEERTRYQTFAEVNHETLQRSLKDFVMNCLAKAYAEAVANGITAFGDYQSAKMVGPANKARTAIYENIPYFYSILGCIGPEETPSVTVELYAYAGGQSGLYISAIIKGLREVEYKYLYPETIPEETEPSDPTDIDDSFVNIYLTCIGCSVSGVERYDVGGVANTIAFTSDTTESEESVSKGSHVVYHIMPNNGYSVSRVIIDGVTFSDLKKANDLPGITIAEYSLGYEMIVTETSEDHNIIFVCDYDSYIVNHDILVTAIKCTGVFYDNPRLTPYSVGTHEPSSATFTVLDGECFKVSFTPIPHTKLVHIIIDGRDYIDEYIEGKMFHYEGRTSDANIFEIDITGTVNINIPVVGMNHSVEVEYEYEIYNVRGIIVTPTSNTERVFDVKLDYTQDYLIALESIINSYTDYQYSNFVVRDPISGKLLSSSDIVVSIHPNYQYKLAVNHATCDADIFIVLEEKPKTCVITGEVVHGNINYSGTASDNSTTSVVITEPIPYGNSAIFRVIAKPDYMFTQAAPNFGASILIDGAEPDMAVLGANDIELAYVNESTIMIGFLNLNKDHTFRVSIDTEKPKYDLVFTGSHTINGSSEEDAVQTATFRVKTEDTTARNYFAANSYAIPIIHSQSSDAELDLTKCEIFVNSIQVENISAIPTQYGAAKVSFSLEADALMVEVSEVTADTVVIFNLKGTARIPDEFDVTVNATNCLVDNKATSMSHVTEGESATFHVTAESGKELPLDENDLLDFERIHITVAKGDKPATVITSDNFPTNMSFVHSNDEATLVLENIFDDYVINIEIDYPEPEPPAPVEYEVSVNTIGCEVEGKTAHVVTVPEGSDVSFHITPEDGKELPLDENGQLDFNHIHLNIIDDPYQVTNGGSIGYVSVTPSDELFPDNMAFVPSNGEAIFSITGVDDNYTIVISMTYPEPLPPEPPAPEKYTVNVVETNVTIEQENPTEVEEGSDLDIVIDANKGTTFENMLFILDKGTDHSYSWAIDLDQDSFNIFDKEIEGVPMIENDGTVVRTREDDHYVYTVHLKDIRNNYEIRFSTVNIDVGQ